MKSTITQKSAWRLPVENAFARDSSISLEARMIYIILKGYCGPDCSLPFPSLATLADIADRDRKTIQRYMTELEGAGYLKRRYGKISGKFTSVRYEIYETCDRKEPLRRAKTALHTVGRKPPYTPQGGFGTTENRPTKSNHFEERGVPPKSAPLPFVTASAPPPKRHPARPEEGAGDESSSGAHVGGASGASRRRERNGEAAMSHEQPRDAQPARSARKARRQDEFGFCNGRETMSPPAP